MSPFVIGLKALTLEQYMQTRMTEATVTIRQFMHPLS